VIENNFFGIKLVSTKLRGRGGWWGKIRDIFVCICCWCCITNSLKNIFIKRYIMFMQDSSLFHYNALQFKQVGNNERYKMVT